MAILAFVLIEAEPGEAREIASQVASLKGVRMAYAVTGPYDVLSFVEAEDVNALGEMVTKKIQCTKGVRKTLTCICVYPQVAKGDMPLGPI